MNIRYLSHSGFLAETELAYYLFDYIKGNLPVFKPEKPLYIFASHAHADHFDKMIFEHPLSEQANAYIFGTDIRKALKKKKLSLPDEMADKVIWAECGQTFTLPTCSILSLKSTDEGAAFAIRETDGTSIYHAGDLNWWHWEGEPLAWNRNMEVNYKREIDKLADWHFKAAFVPLDPRLEDAYCYGMNYFLETSHAEHVFPMHFWEQYDITTKYTEAFHPDAAIHMIEKENEDYEI